eukprot:366240-Chlamydomonas_euryale.AAC.1
MPHGNGAKNWQKAFYLGSTGASVRSYLQFGNMKSLQHLQCLQYQAQQACNHTSAHSSGWLEPETSDRLGVDVASVLKVRVRASFACLGAAPTTDCSVPWSVPTTDWSVPPSKAADLDASVEVPFQ